MVVGPHDFSVSPSSLGTNLGLNWAGLGWTGFGLDLGSLSTKGLGAGLYNLVFFEKMKMRKPRCYVVGLNYFWN